MEEEEKKGRGDKKEEDPNLEAFCPHQNAVVIIIWVYYYTGWLNGQIGEE